VYGNGTSAMTASATIPESALTALSANQVLGSLTAVAPSGLTMPTCSTTASALMWTGGTGFSCNTAIAAPAASITGTTLASNVVLSSLTSVGTIASGTWNGTAITVPYGGTGLATLTSNVIYKGNGTSALAVSALTDNGTIVSSSKSLDATNNGFVTEIANDGTTGTTVNKLAKLSAAAAAIKAATTDTDGIVGIVTGGAGTSSNAQIAVDGQASCVFDGATTAGDFVAISTTTAGDCKDAGSTRSSTSQTIGRVLSTNGGAGTYAVALGLNASSNADATALGTSVTTANPRITGDATSGFYTAGAAKIDVTISGTQIAEWNSGGFNVVSGSVGIGTTSPATGMKADINGPVKIAGTGSEACTASTVGAMRYNATGNYVEICSYP
jgi:hypothetical protein